MILEFHDDEEGETLCGKIEVRDDHEAEQYIRESGLAHVNEVRYVLKDKYGVRAVWNKTGKGQWESIILSAPAARYGRRSYGWKMAEAWTKEQWEREYARV